MRTPHTPVATTLLLLFGFGASAGIAQDRSSRPTYEGLVALRVADAE